MTRMRLYIHVLCLITFTWAATCLGETLAVYQYGDDAHSQATLLDGSDQTWVFHHNGHQDQHEKQALDAECASGGSRTATMLSSAVAPVSPAREP